MAEVYILRLHDRPPVSPSPITLRCPYSHYHVHLVHCVPDSSSSFLNFFLVPPTIHMFLQYYCFSLWSLDCLFSMKVYSSASLLVLLTQKCVPLVTSWPSSIWQSIHLVHQLSPQSGSLSLWPLPGSLQFGSLSIWFHFSLVVSPFDHFLALSNLAVYLSGSSIVPSVW